jgi:hypothetical protein
MIDENWKSIPSWEGRYDVSDLGNIRSLSYRGVKRKEPLIMKASFNDWGYLQIALFDRRWKKHYRVASLVLLAFVGPRPKGKEVSHLDGNKTNNKLSNLRYETARENQHRLKEHGTCQYGEMNPFHKLTSQDVLEIRSLKKLGFSLSNLAAKYKVNPSHISRICLGLAWRHLLPKDKVLGGEK